MFISRRNYSGTTFNFVLYFYATEHKHSNVISITKISNKTIPFTFAE